MHVKGQVESVVNTLTKKEYEISIANCIDTVLFYVLQVSTDQ